MFQVLEGQMCYDGLAFGLNGQSCKLSSSSQQVYTKHNQTKIFLQKIDLDSAIQLFLSNIKCLGLVLSHDLFFDGEMNFGEQSVV